MTCVHRTHRECSCEAGFCQNDPYRDLLVERSRSMFWLSLALSVVMIGVTVLGFNALMTMERQYQIEARV